MKYNFDEPVDRSQNRSAKYDERVKNFGTDDVIPLWIADMDFKTAQPIIDACKKKAEEGIWGYTSRPDSYFKAYADWQERRNGWKFDPSLCSWSLGVVPALAGIIKLFTQKGEKVLIQPPVYPEFFDITENTGRTLVQNNFLERDGVWEVDFEDFERQAKDPEVKLFILCNPHNPLGRVWTKEELESLMDTKWAGKNIVYYDEIDSTNLRIKQLGDEGAVEGTLAVADRQTAGRGRRGRSWDSPAGESISMSILLRPQITPNQAPMLTLVMACSVAEGIMDCKDVCGEQQIQIKWPNDIIIHGKKLVGILTEMSTQIDYINHVTVGVGINVNLTDFPEEIREHATSLRLECGHKVKRAPLIAAIMKRLEENYALFMETGDLSQLMEKYSELLVNKDRDVMILGAKEQYVAHALGINKTGELIVRKEDGTIEEVYAGEVSVRGVYGYV